MINRVKASILLYALFIMVFITIIIGSVILLSYINHIERKSYQIEDNLRANVNSGIALLLADSEILNYGESDSINLYKEDGINSLVTIKKKLWGFNDCLYCKASWGKFLKEKIVWAGKYYKNNESLALYLVDTKNPLCLVGKTEIKGNCMIPLAGIKRGYVEGRNYEGDEFVEGQTNVSDSLLPLDKDKILQNSLVSVLSKLSSSSDINIINYNDINNNLISNSFYKPTVIVYEPGSMIINTTIIGNIIVVSESNIIIERESDLQDVLIYAKNIFIENGFVGSLHCFAQDTIVVGQNSNLQYPSTVATIHLSTKENLSLLKIEAGVQISGTVLQYGAISKKFSKPEIIVSKKSTITGQIYASGSLELLSDVNGSVFTNTFVLSMPSARYINYLSDVKINQSKLPNWFVNNSLINEAYPSKIIKWF